MLMVAWGSQVSLSHLRHPNCACCAWSIAACKCCKLPAYSWGSVKMLMGAPSILGASSCIWVASVTMLCVEFCLEQYKMRFPFYSCAVECYS